MLKHYEIQHPNVKLENIIKTLQDLTQIQDLFITKEGLSQLTETILTELKNQYKKGYDDKCY